MMKNEQDERIKENVAWAMDHLDEISFDEFEQMFEDRDPMEFL